MSWTFNRPVGLPPVGTECRGPPALLKSVFRLLLCAAFFSPVIAIADPASISNPSLPEASSIQYRTLPNGMRYWIRPNAGPSGKISMWLRVGSGSLNEEDDERGLAHLLEHMAFNGSANFPAGTLLKRFESVGLTFGAHQNATTSYLDTIYKLQVPNDSKVVDLGLLYFADVAFRLTLDPREIARERNVVQAERRARDNAAARAFNRQIATLAPGSRFADRLPIGDERVVRQATVEQLRAYYRKWYRPDNTVLLVSGDVDVDTLDALIRKHFNGWPTVVNPQRNHSPGILPYDRDRAEVIHEYGLVAADVNIAYLEPPRDFSSERGYRAWLVHNLGKQMINWRLREQILEGRTPFVSAWAAADTSFGKTLVEAHAKGAPEDWTAILKTLLLEIKGARDHGFSDDEFSHARETMLVEIEKEARDESTALASHWIGIMDSALDEDRRPFDAATLRALCRRLLASITRDEVEAAVRVRYASERRTFTLMLPKREGVKAPKPAEVLALARDVERMPVAKRPERPWKQALLLEEPVSGKTLQHTLNGELNVLSAMLDNGVRLHVRPMHDRKDHVTVRITLAGGRINETSLNLGITEAAALPFKVPATSTLSSVDIRRLMATKRVSVTGRDTSGAIELDIEGEVSDLEEGFRLAHVLLTRARVEPAVFERWQAQAIAREGNREGSVQAQLNDRVDALLTSNDPRFRTLSPKDARRITLADSQAWLNGILATAPIEVAIIGDIDYERALALATKYVGSLPKRASIVGAHGVARQLQIAPGPYKALVKVDTATPKAMVYVGWRGPDWQDARDWNVLDLAGRILTNRLLDEVRERRGLAYSIRARASSNTPYRGNGRFRVSFAVDPLKAEEAANVVQQVVEDLIRTGPTGEELATAREQALNSFRSGSHTPDFWLDVLSDLDYMGGDLAWVRNYAADISRYTEDDIVAVLKKYVRNDRAVRVIGVPSESSATDNEPARQPVAVIN